MRPSGREEHLNISPAHMTCCHLLPCVKKVHHKQLKIWKTQRVGKSFWDLIRLSVDGSASRSRFRSTNRHGRRTCPQSTAAQQLDPVPLTDRKQEVQLCWAHVCSGEADGLGSTRIYFCRPLYGREPGPQRRACTS